MDAAGHASSTALAGRRRPCILVHNLIAGSLSTPDLERTAPVAGPEGEPAARQSDSNAPAALVEAVAAACEGDSCGDYPR